VYGKHEASLLGSFDCPRGIHVVCWSTYYLSASWQLHKQWSVLGGCHMPPNQTHNNILTQMKLRLYLDRYIGRMVA
jgi:hypothetical protein